MNIVQAQEWRDAVERARSGRRVPITLPPDVVLAVDEEVRLGKEDDEGEPMDWKDVIGALESAEIDAEQLRAQADDAADTINRRIRALKRKLGVDKSEKKAVTP